MRAARAVAVAWLCVAIVGFGVATGLLVRTEPMPPPVPPTTTVVTSSTMLGIACPMGDYEVRTGPVEADAIGCR